VCYRNTGEQGKDAPHHQQTKNNQSVSSGKNVGRTNGQPIQFKGTINLNICIIKNEINVIRYVGSKEGQQRKRRRRAKSQIQIVTISVRIPTRTGAKGISVGNDILTRERVNSTNLHKSNTIRVTGIRGGIRSKLQIDIIPIRVCRYIQPIKTTKRGIWRTTERDTTLIRRRKSERRKVSLDNPTRKGDCRRYVEGKLLVNSKRRSWGVQVNIILQP
jgi:hypothetical protein